MCLKQINRSVPLKGSNKDIILQFGYIFLQFIFELIIYILTSFKKVFFSKNMKQKDLNKE